MPALHATRPSWRPKKANHGQEKRIESPLYLYKEAPLRSIYPREHKNVEEWHE